MGNPEFEALKAFLSSLQISVGEISAGEISSSEISSWGIADLSSLHPLAGEYPRALSISISYVPTFRTYSEQKYYEILKSTDARADAAVSAISRFLASAGTRHYCVPRGQDPETLAAEFPHKLAAVRAGLGWIGKSSLLITPQFGPRVRLATVLLDAGLPSGEPVTASRCGECAICVEACPYGCITGAQWHPGVRRDELLDAHLCSSKRETFRDKIGHKHECGLCLLACPHGNGTGKVTANGM